MNALCAKSPLEPWFNYTKDSTPPLGVVLGVRHKFANLPGGLVSEDATWDGKCWIRRHDGERFPLNHYYAWRSYEV